MADNSLHDRRYGKWSIAIYVPVMVLGPYEGNLWISKDSYYVEDAEDPEIILVTVPSQNVSYCENKLD